jgi:NADH:ubiquinone oxidoreductase subunit K
LSTGINHYLVISALIFGLGVYSAIAAKNRTKAIIGVSLIFISSLLNIAAFSGIKWFNPEGQILFVLTALICLIIILTGVVISRAERETDLNQESNK